MLVGTVGAALLREVVAGVVGPVGVVEEGSSRYPAVAEVAEVLRSSNSSSDSAGVVVVTGAVVPREL